MNSSTAQRLHRDVARSVVRSAHLLLEGTGVVHLDRAVASDADRVTLERTRCRPFQVDAILVETATVAWAFKLLLGFEPVRRATQMGAYAFQREDFLLAVVFGVHNPYTELRLEPLFDLPRR